MTKRRKMKRFRLDEISAVDVPAQTPAEALIMKNAKTIVARETELNKKELELIEKGERAFLTDENDGHQHKIYVYLSSDLEYLDAYCSYAGSSPSYEDQHSHDIVWDEKTSKFVMVNDKGHIHSFDGDELTKYVEELKTKIKAKAAEIMEKKKMDFELLKNLSAEDFEYIKNLDEKEATEFVAKSASERENIRKAKELIDPVEYTTADGIELRKSAGKALIEMAKRADENAAELAKARAEKEELEFAKKVEEKIPHLSGETAVKIKLYKAAEAIGEDAVAILVSNNEKMAKAFETKGESEKEATVDKDELTKTGSKFQTLVAKYAKENKVSEAAATMHLLTTEEGQEAYKADSK